MRKEIVSIPRVETCPFCQHAPKVILERVLNWVISGQTFDTFKVVCKNYKCQVKPDVSASDLNEALKKWNDRDAK